jgi:hypothetical protein
MSNRKAASLAFCVFFLALLCGSGTAWSSASPGTLELSASNYYAAPGTAAVFITVKRTGGSSGSAVAQYGTVDGTAVAGTDYTASSGTVTWSDGDSSPKSFMVSAFTNYNYANNGPAWGLQAYMGIQTSGSGWTPFDMRSQARAMMDIEGPDIAGTYFAGQGAAEGFQPLDIIAALNQSYQASHAFWTHYFGSEGVFPGSGTVTQVSPWAVWSSLAPVINAHPLTSTAYPASYPHQ